MKKKYFFLLAFFLIIGIANAQTPDRKWGIGLMGGVNQYNGDLGSSLFQFDKALYGFGSLSLNRYLLPSFNVGLQGSYGDYGYHKTWTQDESKTFKGQKADASLLISYKLNNGYLFKENATIAPYLAAGAGFAIYGGSADNIYMQGTDFILPVGAGIKCNLTSSFALQYQFLYYFTNHDTRDYVQEKKKDGYGQNSLGLVFSFGKPKDSDKDGVPDKFDKCPLTPTGVLVTSDGCPIDKDKDGIADYLDKCPDIAGIAAFNGCPDSDGDGVQNSEDKCPNTPKGVTVDKSGCPVDADGDGVPDYLDKCPNTPNGVTVDKLGCPVDADMDGVPDYLDKCPNTPKGVTIDKDGCPTDKDADGIPDYLDKCPDVFGIAANKGCPEVKKETKKIFEQALTGIQFESGKDIIKRTSYSILNQVVKVMQENLNYNLEINGYTDSQGNDEKNLVLSQKRADAVEKYLLNKGVNPNRMASKGYGEAKPVADNKTAEGRSQNRRVEFKIIF
jgi:outer membrane protein OmpA-like peptidoglycan-associated protein